METRQIVSKFAFSMDNKKLGRIIRIDKLPGKTIKKDVQYAIILVRKIMKKDTLVPIEVSKLTKIDGLSVLFNITKKEFDEETERVRALKQERETYHGHLRMTQTRTGYSDPTGFSSRGKERKK